MEIKIYKTNDDNRVINKTLELLKTKNVILKDNVNISSPMFILKYEKSLFENMNYCYISEYKRYYYIINKECLDSGHYSITLSCDVLMSFKDSFINTSMLINRTSNKANSNKELSDSHIQTTSQKIIMTEKIDSNVFNIKEYSQCKYLLNVIGGV